MECRRWEYVIHRKKEMVKIKNTVDNFLNKAKEMIVKKYQQLLLLARIGE